MELTIGLMIVCATIILASTGRSAIASFIQGAGLAGMTMLVITLVDQSNATLPFLG